MAKKLPAIATNIKSYRGKHGISQVTLSKMTGVTLHTIAKIESGATPDPRINTLQRIARALRVSVDELLK